MNEKIRQFFEEHEGRKNEVYKDSRGFRTVGIGHLLDHEQSPEELDVLGVRPEDVVSVSDAQIDALFEIDYNEARDDAELIFHDIWDEISEVRQAVIVSQIFQLGVGGFRKFKNMIRAMKDLDWERAAKESLDSRAARQTPERWGHQANMLRHNTWDGKLKTPEMVVPSQSSDFSVPDYFVSDLADLKASLSTLTARVEALEKQVFQKQKRKPFSP